MIESERGGGGERGREGERKRKGKKKIYKWLKGETNKGTMAHLHQAVRPDIC